MADPTLDHKSRVPVEQESAQSTQDTPCDSILHHKARTLTEEERIKLTKDTQLVSDYKQQKLEKEAQKNWDKFYMRNKTNFFKDRHWTTREFHELCGGARKTGDQLTILEVGCGVGNLIYPLLEEDPSLFCYACDFSPRAVQFVKDHPAYRDGRCHAFHCDITKDDLVAEVTEPVDLVTMIFVLSAVHPDKMLPALENIWAALKPGGVVLFRDYGQYDYAQLRFSAGHKLMENFYVRQDGTRAYYFTDALLGDLFRRAGFAAVANDYVVRETVNKKEGICVPRIFLQGKFRKVTAGCDTVEGSVEPDTQGDTVEGSVVSDTQGNTVECGSNVISIGNKCIIGHNCADS